MPSIASPIPIGQWTQLVATITTEACSLNDYGNVQAAYHFRTGIPVCSQLASVTRSDPGIARSA